MLKQTHPVLITAEGVNGEWKDFFVGLFKNKLMMNGSAPVTGDPKGESASRYDAVIALKCYCFDYKSYSLWGPADQPNVNIGGKKSATGLGKRIGCRVTITHKQLGPLFDGDIEGRTPDAVHLSPEETSTALAAPGGFSAYLEERARQSFRNSLDKSQAWFLVTHMGPNN
jgi:hypothetical protein